MVGMRSVWSFLALGCVGLAAACAASNDADGAAADESALIDPNQPPMSKERLASIAAPLKSLDQVPAALPKDFLINFTLKHGRLYNGEHGHLTETVVSQSASPDAPRAILWDEKA